MSDRTRAVPGWRETAVVAIVSMGAGAAVSLVLGQDFNGDILNYHFYNGYALLHGRAGQDFMAAGPVRSCFNPLLDALHFAGIQHLPPKAFGALLGALQGLNTLIVWAVARTILGANGVWLAPIAAFLGATGQNAISLLGTMFGDNTVSLPALAGVLVLVGVDRPGSWRFAAAGVLAGAAVGLKLTMVAPLIGLGALAVALGWRRPSSLGAFAMGALAGWGVADGWWAAGLWHRFANPVFPFLNSLFRSPFAPQVWINDPRWPPRDLLGWLSPPVHAALGIHRQLQEVPLRDARLLTVFVAAALWFATGAVRRRLRFGPPALLLVWWLATYAAWVTVFHYYRYATVLEMLAPTVALALLLEVWPRRAPIVAAVMAATLLLTTSVGLWWRNGKWSDTWFTPEVPSLGEQAHQLVLLPEKKTSFIVPYFRPDASFVGLQWPELHGPAMTGTIAARTAAHRGPLLILLRSWTDEQATEALRPFGLGLASSCEPLSMGRGWRYRLCPLRRLGRPRDPPHAGENSSPDASP